MSIRPYTGSLPQNIRSSPYQTVSCHGIAAILCHLIAVGNAYSMLQTASKSYDQFRRYQNILLLYHVDKAVYRQLATEYTVFTVQNGQLSWDRRDFVPSYSGRQRVFNAANRFKIVVLVREIVRCSLCILSIRSYTGSLPQNIRS